MTAEDVKFLEDNKHHWQTVKEGYLLGAVDTQRFEKIYQSYMDARFYVNHWCKGCVLKMIERIYTHYENTSIRKR